ncbi:MAG TPA: GNAT family protein [Phototrophicaceae bacterium]|jgi:RimJ/RimL family protein N-acetyltransferase|nr:GNAT family protein [Phototrophicaceae bacterium]
MLSSPVLKTERLVLRPVATRDAPNIQKLAGDFKVARNTLSMPYPYPDGAAESFVAWARDELLAGEAFTFGIILNDELIGCIGLHLQPQHKHAEMGYWLGVPYWGQGYASEAARTMMEFGFEMLDLNRIYAAHFTRNPASGRVMQKIGMRYEGTLRQHYFRFDEFHDTAYYAILREDYTAGKNKLAP